PAAAATRRSGRKSPPPRRSAPNAASYLASGPAEMPTKSARFCAGSSRDASGRTPRGPRLPTMSLPTKANLSPRRTGPDRRPQPHPTPPARGGPAGAWRPNVARPDLGPPGSNPEPDGESPGFRRPSDPNAFRQPPGGRAQPRATHPESASGPAG